MGKPIWLMIYCYEQKSVIFVLCSSIGFQKCIHLYSITQSSATALCSPAFPSHSTPRPPTDLVMSCYVLLYLVIVLLSIFFPIRTKSGHSLWWLLLFPMPSSLRLLSGMLSPLCMYIKTSSQSPCFHLVVLCCKYSYHIESKMLSCFFPTQWSSIFTLAYKKS